MKRLQLHRPHFKLRLNPPAGTYATNPRWSNADLDPVPVRHRIWGQGDFVNYWVSDMFAPPLWSTVSVVMSLGLTASRAIPCIFFGFLICGFVVGLNGRTAAIMRVPFSVMLRSSFGMWGCMPAIAVRFVAAIWSAVTVVQGAGFTENMIGAIWPSFLDLPNFFPESAGIASNTFGALMIFWFIQTCLSLIPMHKMKYFFLFKTIIVIPTWLALFIWGAVITHGGGRLVTGPTNPTRDLAYAVFTAMNVTTGLFSSLAVNFPDFGRFSKRENSGQWQFLMLPVLGTAGALAPIFVTSAHLQLHGVLEWQMPSVIAAFDSRAARFFCGFSFMIATIGNQLAADTYPFSIDCSALMPRYFNVRRGSLFLAAFCLFCNPWLIIKNGQSLIAFLSGYSCLMGPIAAVMIVNFYVVHKKKLDIGELYNPHGIYRYWHGWNWRAWLALFCGFGPVAPGFAHAINPNLVIPNGLIDLYSASWLFSFSITAMVYYLLSTRLPQQETFLDHAVLPPQTEEEELARAGISTKGLSAFERDDLFEAAEKGSLPDSPADSEKLSGLGTTNVLEAKD